MLILTLNTRSVKHPVVIHNCLKSVVSEDKLQKWDWADITKKTDLNFKSQMSDNLAKEYDW